MDNTTRTAIVPTLNFSTPYSGPPTFIPDEKNETKVDSNIKEDDEEKCLPSKE